MEVRTEIMKYLQYKSRNSSSASHSIYQHDVIRLGKIK